MEPQTEMQKMLAGDLYRAADPELVQARHRARAICRRFNLTTEEVPEQRIALLRELLGTAGTPIEIEPPFFCDYGFNIRLGANVYVNFGCVLLDCNRITIGDNALLGPGVHIYAATHPVDPAVRASLREMARPVTIGRNVWLGGGAIVCPGVEIGDNCVIGAGSVVTRSIQADHVAVGNPCRVVRRVTDKRSGS
jgi:maltose O-acetyltransferase